MRQTTFRTILALAAPATADLCALSRDRAAGRHLPDDPARDARCFLAELEARGVAAAVPPADRSVP